MGKRLREGGGMNRHRRDCTSLFYQLSVISDLITRILDALSATIACIRISPGALRRDTDHQ
jgi:hypothetical protein